MNLDKEDKFYEIKLQIIKTERLTDLESAETFEQRKKKIRKEQSWFILLIEKLSPYKSKS